MSHLLTEMKCLFNFSTIMLYKLISSPHRIGEIKATLETGTTSCTEVTAANTARKGGRVHDTSRKKKKKKKKLYSSMA